MKRFFPAIVTILMVTSCVPNKRLSYVQDDGIPNIYQRDNMYFVDTKVDMAIRQGDELYIRVTSADEGETAFDQTNQERIYDPSLLSYTVDNEGYVKLPYINRIKISGLDLIEASDSIENELKQYLLYPSVNIRFVNNKITILGEVNRPGVYVFNYKSINILQAVGYANDISTFGNRKKVLIVREEGEYRAKYEIDLTSDELLSSPYYMVKSNDIIYVEPLKRKIWAMSEVPYDLLLSIASLTIVVLTFMINYVN